MNRTKKFFYNSITTALLQLVIMAAGFITPRVLLQSYGSEINGLVSSITQFIVYFNLAEAGLSGAAIYALYKPLAESDYKAINSIVSAARRFYTQAGYIFVSLTIGLAVLYPIYVKSEVITPFNIGILVLILGVNGALEFFTLSKYRVLLSADQRTYVVSLASIVYIVVNTSIIVVLANLGVNIVVLRFVALLSIFLRSFILMAYVKLKYKHINYKEKPNNEALDKRWDVLYLQILGVIQTGAPVVILTIIVCDLKLISVYMIFNMVITGIDGVLGIFKSGLSASFGDVIARGENKIMKRAYSEFELVYFSIITIIYSITYVTIMPFIHIYTKGITDVSYDLPIIGALFVVNGLLNNLKTPQGMLVISAGLYKETKLQTTIQGGIVVVLGCMLAPFYGIAGVLTASIVSNLYRDIDLLFFIPRNVTKLPIRNTFHRWIRMLFSAVVICVPFFFIELKPTGYATWAFCAAVAVVYAILVVAASGFVFDKVDMKSTVRRIFLMTGVKNLFSRNS